MRPQKVEDKTLLKGLMKVLRKKGYDGANLNDLANSSGLKKASLYHRFPEGKKGITNAVLEFVRDSLHTNIYMPLADNKVAPKVRLENVLITINNFYNNGEETCILRSMSLDSGLELFGEVVKNSVNEWVNGFKILGKELGYNNIEANDKAHHTIVLVQGSLILTSIMDDTKYFKDSLEKIKEMYN